MFQLYNDELQTRRKSGPQSGWFDLQMDSISGPWKWTTGLPDCCDLDDWVLSEGFFLWWKTCASNLRTAPRGARCDSFGTSLPLVFVIVTWASYPYIHRRIFPKLHPTETGSTPSVRVLLSASASTRPCSYLVFHGEGVGGGGVSAELFSSASADSYHFWSYLLATLQASQDGCISNLLMSGGKKTFTLDSLFQNGFLLLPAGISGEHS